MLDAKIASALKKIIANPDFKKRVNLEEQQAQMRVRFLRGRQIACMVYEYFRVSGAHDAVLDSTDLFSISSHDDDIQDFDASWDQALGCEYESLINSKQYWPCMNKKSINIDRSRVSRSCRPW